MRHKKGTTAMLIVISIIFACAEQEVPNICGLYEGTRTFGYNTSGTFLVDIMRCDEDGISGETEIINSNSYVVKSFEGDWSDDGDEINIAFTETAVIEHSGVYADTKCYYYQATLVDDKLAGEYYRDNTLVGRITLMRAEAVVKK